jgi:autotransporter-associated beta strand protein
MTISTWEQSANGFYTVGANWSAGEPGAGDTAEFAASSRILVTIDSGSVNVGEWLFSAGAPQYNFLIGDAAFFQFEGSGIVINAGSAHIFNFGDIFFRNQSSAGSAFIYNFFGLAFGESSSAGSSTIDTAGTAFTGFHSTSTGESAQFITEAGGTVDFSDCVGPGSDHRITAGSIAGAGTYALGADQLTVGLDGRSTTVSGAIDDGGHFSAGTGASLVKVGLGTLTLSGSGNTYSGGTTLEAGALDLAAIGAAGTRPIIFAGRATLAIENAALSGHAFANPVRAFGKHDILDLTGLKFHSGATATYHKATHLLTIHSGNVTDTLTLLSPLKTHFTVTKDGHGGSDVMLAHGASPHAALLDHELSLSASAGDFLLHA